MKNNNDDDNLIYLDTYVLQQDMRVRMPKSILENLGLEKGKSKLKIYSAKVPAVMKNTLPMLDMV